MLALEIKKRLPGRDVVSDTELKLLLGGSANSRHARVRRAIARGELLRIRRGLYCLAPPLRSRTLDLNALSSRIYGPSYVSLESALAFHGWIPERVTTTTCCTNRRSRTFDTPLGVFAFERTTARPLLDGVERVAGEAPASSFMMATPFKALADYVYVHKKNWDSLDPLLLDLRIEEEIMRGAVRDRLDAIASGFRSRRVERFLAAVQRELER